MKYADIRKKLVTESVTAVIVVAALSAATYYITTVYDDYEKEKGSLQTQLASVTNEYQTLQNKNQKIQQNIGLYHDLMEKSDNEGLLVDRQILRTKIEELKTRYFLNDLSIAMGPVQERTGDKYRLKSNLMIASDLTVDFDTLTDEDIFSFLHAFQMELPGGLRITKFSISRTSKVTDEALRAIAKTGQYSMVKGEAKFTWMGIRPVDQDIDVTAKKAKP